jgi:hypothetical protein
MKFLKLPRFVMAILQFDMIADGVGSADCAVAMVEVVCAYCNVITILGGLGCSTCRLLQPYLRYT